MSIANLTPPFSLEAEQGVLGGLMLDNSTWDLLADRLIAEDFFAPSIGRFSRPSRPWRSKISLSTW